MNAKPASHLLGAPHDPKANHIRCAIFLALLAALLLFTCQAWGPLDNPTDPKSATYQGYDTVTNPAAIAAALPADKGSLSGSTLTATKVTGATAYELRIAASAADLDTAPFFTKMDYATNVMDISASGIQDKTTYWWKVRCRAADGSPRAWSAPASFATSWTTAATPTFSPVGGTYATDQSVTISTTTANASIYYTTDGMTAPTTASTKYMGAITAKVSPATTIQAIAIAPLFSAPAIASATYTNASIALVSIPAGNFNNGTSTVNVSAFKMAKYDVTQSLYQTVTGSKFSYFSANSDAATCPVEQVTWYDAVEFCNKLSTKHGLAPVYTITGRSPASGYPITSATVSATLTNNGYRLPTEAQWEYAARAGTTTTYYWGNASDDATVGQNAWFSGSKTHAVGQKTANSFGLYDMAGNVWQWCWDWYGTYPSGAQTDPTGASSGSHRVIRGGSWGDSSVGLTSAYRNYNIAGNLYCGIGFRVCAP